MSRPARPLLLVLAAVLALADAHAVAAPRVVVTIAPVHGLVAAVMDGVGMPQLLLPGAASPHAYALRPSQREALARADLVIWVGETLERFLAKMLADEARTRRTVALVHAEGVELLAARRGGVFAGTPAGAAPAGATDHDHAHDDPHLWLDPANAHAIVALAARELSVLDPANAGRYAANATRAAARIDALEREIARRLAPVRAVPYVVFHDAYHAFEAHFGLNAVAAVTVAPERPPGARRVAEIRARIVAIGARCVFSEPQFEPRLVATLVQGTGARSGVLDPIGRDIPPGPDAWFALMRALAESLEACLSPG